MFLAPLLTLALTLGGPPALHCQVPCGIYGDKLRIDLLMEDIATIEKGMRQITELGSADHPNWNQLVRWIETKDEHAQKIQDQAAQYWLAQRIKAPASLNAPDAEAAWAKYNLQLTILHRMIVSAMKCKQTTDEANVAALRQAVKDLAASYFTKEDLEHLKGHDG